MEKRKKKSARFYAVLDMAKDSGIKFTKIGQIMAMYGCGFKLASAVFNLL